MGAEGPAVRFRGVRRHFGDVRALDGVDLDIEEGEFFSLLGPSGSGKTTCLRLIAGFDRPTSGSIELHGAAAAALPPYERDVNTVFQDYALFPHMSVAENVGYGLAVRRVPKADREGRVLEMLDLVRLPGLGSRRPAQLSGGQRQRVALARALVNRPRVLLLDEPLGALDLKLRQQMQVELMALQERLGITFVYVTHDQEEALAMSDRLAVFNQGRIEQVGTPADVYESPATPFVAGFVGVSNVIGGALVRPEKIRIMEAGAAVPEGAAFVDGRIESVVYLGVHTRYLVEAGDGSVVTVVEQNRETTSGDVHAARGRAVRLVWAKSAGRGFSGHA